MLIHIVWATNPSFLGAHASWAGMPLSERMLMLRWPLLMSRQLQPGVAKGGLHLLCQAFGDQPSILPCCIACRACANQAILVLAGSLSICREGVAKGKLHLLCQALSCHCLLLGSCLGWNAGSDVCEEVPAIDLKMPEGVHVSFQSFTHMFAWQSGHRDACWDARH